MKNIIIFVTIVDFLLTIIILNLFSVPTSTAFFIATISSLISLMLIKKQFITPNRRSL